MLDRARAPQTESSSTVFFSRAENHPANTRPGSPAPAPGPLTTRVRATSTSLARPPAPAKTFGFFGKRIARGPFRTDSRKHARKYQPGKHQNALPAPRRHPSARCTPAKNPARARARPGLGGVAKSPQVIVPPAFIDLNVPPT